MTIVGAIKLLDGQQRQRGTVKVSVDGDVVTLTTDRDGVPERLYFKPAVAERLSEFLSTAADIARGA